MFDPVIIPAAAMSSAGVAEVNRVVGLLEARLVDHIEVAEPGSRFQLSNMVRAYDQAQLRRALAFLRGGRDEALKGNNIVAITCVRGVYETLAAFLDFERKLIPLIESGDFDAVNGLLRTRSLATRLETLMEVTGDQAVQATNILTQIDKMTDVYPDSRTDYDHLCEFAHPNGLGAYLYFAVDDKSANVIAFNDEGPDPDGDLKWVLIAGHLLIHMEDALGRIESALVQLSRLGAERAPQTSG